MCVATIDEKILQRQMSKLEVADTVTGGKGEEKEVERPYMIENIQPCSDTQQTRKPYFVPSFLDFTVRLSVSVS